MHYVAEVAKTFGKSPKLCRGSRQIETLGEFRYDQSKLLASSATSEFRYDQRRISPRKMLYNVATTAVGQQRNQ